MTDVDYLLIGHIAADIAPGARELGGTVSYGAVTAQALGLRVGVLTSAAAGEPLLGTLDGVAAVTRLESAQTTTFENIYEGEHRTQMIRGVAQKIDSSHIPSAWRSVPMVHIGPVADEVDPAIVYSFPDSLTLLTPQGWLRQWDTEGRVTFRRWFDPDILRAFDIIVLSEDDIQESPDLEQKIAPIARYFMVTRGSKGGTWYHEGKAHHYDATRVDSRYLTGAGDVFAVSVMAAYHRSRNNMAEAVRAAAYLAAYSTTREGMKSAPLPGEVAAAFGMLS